MSTLNKNQKMSTIQKKFTSGILVTLLSFFTVFSLNFHGNIAHAALSDVLKGNETLGDWAQGAGEDTVDCLFGGDCGSGSKASTSFTDFKGGMTAPSKEGYSEGLTASDNARDFILNVTNFILGFLGLLAVLIIIYGGFLYMTANGEQDKAEKGKKNITYALVGIIIILSSFALVSTILRAPTGTDEKKGAAEEQVTGSGVQKSFNRLALRLQTMANDIVSLYLFEVEVATDFAKISTSIDTAFNEMSACAESVKDEDAHETMCGDNWGDGLKQKLDTFKANIDQAISLLNNIQQKIPGTNLTSLSKKGEVKDLADALNNYWIAAIGRAEAKAADVGCDDKVSSECHASENSEVFAAFLNMKGPGNEFVGIEIKNQLSDLQGSITDYFKDTINLKKAELKEIYDQVSPVTNIADTQFEALVTLANLKAESGIADDWDAAEGSLKNLVVAFETYAKAKGDAMKTTKDSLETQLATVITQLSELYKVLKDIQFVDTQLTASVVEGNAPLVVNFSAIGSLDPTGKTIQNNQIEWDLDGNGTAGEGLLNKTGSDKVFLNCNEGDKAAVVTNPNPNPAQQQPASNIDKQNVSCTYKAAGTYRVKLLIKSTDAKIGDGISTVIIQVNPPQNKINLKLLPGNDTPIDIIQYNQDGFLITDKDEVTVRASTALNPGITFDATATRSKNDLLTTEASDGAKVKWDYGDGSSTDDNKKILDAIAGNLKKTHKYEKAGTYNVSVEVTDKNRIIDRKLFTLNVQNIAAQLSVNSTNIKVNNEVRFDGSSSVSDGGEISAWTWALSLVDPQTGNLTAVNDFKASEFENQEEVTYNFKTSGKYRMMLTITDNLGQTDSASEDILVTSEPPSSQFKVTTPSEKQPGTVLVDGSRSYDPDNAKADLVYEWEINGQKVTSQTTSGVDWKIVDLAAFNEKTNQFKVKFSKPGTQTITLTTIDPNGYGNGVPQPGKTVEKDITIDNVLDIDWGTTDEPTAQLKLDDASGQYIAPLTVNIVSENATDYEVDFGDGTDVQGGVMDSSNTQPVTHNYKAPGNYLVRATVFDEEDNDNEITRKVYVSGADTPLAVAGIKVNGEDIVSDGVNSIKVNRKDVVTFYASKSKNVDGTGRRLLYSWDYGVGKSTKESFTNTYKDLGTYDISLKVTNEADQSKTSTNGFTLEVVGEAPDLKTLTAVPTGSSLTTPVTVNLTAVGAEDKDGQITRYRWWYYDPNFNTEELGVQVSNSPNASVTIGTRGAQDEKKTYKFAVAITDDENNTVSSEDILDENTIPELEVVNGPNSAPVAKFNVDRTNIMVGESVNFTSASSDPDGTIKAYFWDFEGNGFSDNSNSEGPNLSHTFNTPARDGIKVRLKVRDNNESEAVSDPITIYVDSTSQPPIAAFTTTINDKTVQFQDKSTADEGLTISKWAWDFDTSKDSNGDGTKDNDLESTNQNPTHTYENYSTYFAQLTVTDDEGNSAKVKNLFLIKNPVTPKPAAPTTQQTQPKPAAPTTQQTQPKPATPPLDARLITTPAPSYSDGKIHLKGTSAKVLLDFSTSTGKITKYIIDKNANFDTNGNAVKDDDEDFTATKPGSWETDYFSEYGKIRVRLTVIDETGKKDFVEREIIFDDAKPAPNASGLQANLLGTGPEGVNDIFAVIVSIFGLGVMYTSLRKLKNQK